MIKDKKNFSLEVSTWKTSWLSMVAYCKEKGFNYQTFMYHASRIKKKELVTDDQKTFTQIEVAECKTITGIEYHFPMAIILFFPSAVLLIL